MRHAVLYYDAGCRLCRAWAEWVVNHRDPATLSCLPVQSMDRTDSGIDPGDALVTLHMVVRDGSREHVLRGVDAVLYALRACRGYQWLGRLGSRRPFRVCARALYSWTSKRRARRGERHDACCGYPSDRLPHGTDDASSVSVSPIRKGV
ncbi:DUF393 domain-containing protein [Candidatus Poribacteria bacterium]|nr:DUF393 domain-containing protein [Candidatus Poribacteria bacterium]